MSWVLDWNADGSDIVEQWIPDEPEPPEPTLEEYCEAGGGHAPHHYLAASEREGEWPFDCCMCGQVRVDPTLAEPGDAALFDCEVAQ